VHAYTMVPFTHRHIIGYNSLFTLTTTDKTKLF
jgi:hypothetical protein